jgi:hypothetical protein
MEVSIYIYIYEVKKGLWYHSKGYLMDWKKKKDKHDNDYYWKELKNQIWHLISIEKMIK